MRKLILIAFLSVCLASFVQSGVIDDVLYGAIKKIVDVRYPQKTPDERECIAKYLRDDIYKDRSSSEQYQFNHSKLERDMEDYFGNTETKCEWIAFAKTPLGICIIIGIILMLISLICGLIKCCCC
ncbi:hypothetical protein PVAND_009367 [Polypedilum vanderplanki]|uniref:Uncharacterized protein n=1 Tax=Polypedilum vanderplanki TaxID=319348 RepID=A0A9J6CD28_POLVA|nr:hypothetical protein PVAND_009367 [Polypedilum vanderplanki]